jgi:signal transduction histidine kinase
MQELAEEAEAARRRLALLAEAAGLVGASFDTPSLLPALAARLVPELGDACVILLASSGAQPVIAPACADEGTARAIEQAARACLRAEGALDAPPAGGREGGASILAVPIRGGASTHGALAFLARARCHCAEDARLARQIAERVAVALDRAELHQRALDAVRARDDLLAAVSHDLRSPLQTIVMSTAVLAKRGAEDACVSAHLARIRRSAEHMDRLIRDLVDTAKMEAGCFTVEPRPCDVAKVVAEVIDTMAPAAASKSICLGAERDDAPGVPRADLVAPVDEGRLVQVLENLVGNAVKFTPAGGTITVGAARGVGEVRLWVRDTGPGIPAEHLPCLFDRFWQARQTARLGSGLGLFISKGIVEAHGGRIWAESELGAGSTFLVTLPLAQ